MKQTTCLMCLLSLALACSAQSLLKPGDMVAICGDSITEQKQYSVFIEDYLLMCQPEMNVRVAQFGRAGDVNDAVGRTGNDVLRFQPTVATTSYGMNDGNYRELNQDILRNYTRYTGSSIQKLKAGGVRVIVVGSPGCVDSVSFNHDSAKDAVKCNNTLASLRDTARTVAEENGVLFADVNTPMMDVMGKAKAKYGPRYSVCGNDAVHPDANGHLIMAYAFLKALGCSGDIGTITVDLAGNQAEATEGHKILSCQDGSVEVESTRYPFCFFGDPEKTGSTSGVVEFLPFNEDLNRFRLVVTNAAGEYLRVTWGATSKVFAATDLARGINLAAEFVDNPFCEHFKQVEDAIRKQQDYETVLTKSLLQSLPDWQSIAPDQKEALDNILANAMAKEKSLFDSAAATVAPVRHALKIETMSPDWKPAKEEGSADSVAATTTPVRQTPPMETAGPAGKPDSTGAKYPAANASVGNGATIVDDGAAAGGKCAQNLHLDGSYVEFAGVDGGSKGGQAAIRVHYATQDGARLRLTVNGADYSSLNLPGTGAWDAYTGETGMTVPLQPGKTNIVRLTGGNGGVNINYLTVGPPMETAGTAGKPASTGAKYPAENASVGNGATIVDDGAAAGGKCAQNLHLDGSYVEFAGVDGGSKGGQAAIRVHYAAQDDAKLRLTVNSADYSSLNLPGTGAWDAYTGETGMTVPLQPGKTNIVRLTGGNGGVNIDYLKVTPLMDAP